MGHDTGVSSGKCTLVGNGNVQHVAGLLAHHLRLVALAARVKQREHVAAREVTRFAIANGEVHLTGKHCDNHQVRRCLEIRAVAGLRETHFPVFYVLVLGGDAPWCAALRQIGFAKKRMAVLIDVHTAEFHGGLPLFLEVVNLSARKSQAQRYHGLAASRKAGVMQRQAVYAHALTSCGATYFAALQFAVEVA